MNDPFLSRRIPLSGRRLVIDAPAGDYAFLRYRSGRGFRSYTALCRALLSPDAVVIDIGANIGLTSLIAADVARGGRVLAIEGAPRNFAALARNLGAHAPKIAIPIHCAVGPEKGEVTFVDNSAFGHVVSADSLVATTGTTVPQKTIDDIVTEHALLRVDLIKLDIEGFEQDALAGAPVTLARFDPVVFLEFNVFCQIVLYDRNPRRFLDWLLATFSELHVWRDGRLTSVRETGALGFLQSNMIDRRCNDDLIATTSPERIARLRTALHQGGFRGGIWARLRR
ncbi:FkbM family methyltransferase [Methylobacterium haplocladii]|uniref:Methyltransferase FkbM domain-containing protein n=1 Tax=Methylobacterium haplocladii TaxID=1176176 RepID=A0A512IJ37_9HYPH|nr:FkbM family methyltransferase [Methylobacterium haplocladii]GEO97727.1 hypothetical protein MHA02_01150 [Methylobacterium haplocladii]GJD84043.1 hypothetical protein HPGCJGGD_1918 [Methylobacterium haplocladii]GLS57457.1 hypothetical protein GCM10007887_01120 [Methylobacterium haplocladii]